MLGLTPAALPADSPPRALPVELPSGTRILAEVADTPAKRRLGLMFREKLPENGGMLFIYEEENRLGIWMKNCRIPLDIVWLDSGRRVVSLRESAVPCLSDPCPVYYPDGKARYVLEAAAGLIRKENIRIGDVFEF